MKQYIAQVDISGELEDVHFQTNDNPVEYLWGRYGMSTYIATLKEEELEAEIEIDPELDLDVLKQLDKELALED